MTKQNREELDILGFITVRRHVDLGYFGGLLLLNSLGRPLEFHCTLPHRPNRAQEILYGASLEPFLCGEQIARVLVTRAKKAPSMVFTDCQPVLTLRNVLNLPVLYITDVDFEPTNQLSRPETIPADMVRGQLTKVSVSTIEEYSADLVLADRIWKELQPRIDVAEPFGRIHDALMEAHPTSRAA